MNFGELLAQRRREKAARDHEDISVADVARAMGLSRSAVIQWEKNLTRPRDLATAQRLADYLGCTIEDLGIDVRSLPPVFQKPAKFKKEAKRPFHPNQSTKRRKGNGWG